MQELVQVIEELDVDMLQQIVGRTFVMHGLELVNKVDHGHDQRKPMHNMPHLDKEGMLQDSQVMVQQPVEKGKLKGAIPKLDYFNGEHRPPRFHFMCGKSK